MTADGLFWMMYFAAFCLYLAVSAAIMESLIPWIKKKAPCEAGTSTERKQWKLKIRLLKHERREKSSAAGSTVGTADQNAATGTGK